MPHRWPALSKVVWVVGIGVALAARARADEPQAKAGQNACSDRARRPNVVLVMTDDQGWGDAGFHGNPHLKTPHLDALAAESLELTQFYVCPVCSPTRASLMTGRYNYRTGAIDTYLGRSTMATDEVTLAEMFAAAGYRTGIFGKWHLGDNYPSRPGDQGFGESLVHRGGGMVQPADPPGGSYFDPILAHNGHDIKTHGYCSDVFTDAAMAFIEKHVDEPFFVYLPFNAPHTPLQVPPEYHQQYQGLSLDDNTARIYGMVANIDDNLGRLLDKLKALDLDERTIVVFLTDNGPQQGRYNGNLRDRKGSVYDGGIHVPCLVRWPGHFEAGSKAAHVAAHIDLAPTLLAACGVEAPSTVEFDGINLLPILAGDAPAPERLLFFQWHRGDVPERHRACAVRGPRFKLVRAERRGRNNQAAAEWELYDLAADPGEKHNVIAEHREVARQMQAAYDRWFDDVGSTRGYPVPHIVAGTTHENPVTLTRQDWRGPKANWEENSLGHWEVDFAKAGKYDVTLRMSEPSAKATTRLRVGDVDLSQELPAGSDRVVYRDVELPAGRVKVEGTLEVAGEPAGVHYIDLHCQQPTDE